MSFVVVYGARISLTYWDLMAAWLTRARREGIPLITREQFRVRDEEQFLHVYSEDYPEYVLKIPVLPVFPASETVAYFRNATAGVFVRFLPERDTVVFFLCWLAKTKPELYWVLKYTLENDLKKLNIVDWNDKRCVLMSK